MTATPLIDDAIGASPQTAARVIGVTEHRLREWAQRRLIEPSSRPRVGRQAFAMYTLEDLVQGRVVAELRGRDVSMQQISIIVQAVQSQEHPRPLASLRWGVSGRQAFVEINGEWYGGRQPRQGVLVETIDLEQIRSDARRNLRRPIELAGQITRRRGVQGSRPIFAGTRVPVETVERYLSEGVPARSILESFPTLYEDDVAAARRRMSA